MGTRKGFLKWCLEGLIGSPLRMSSCNVVLCNSGRGAPFQMVFISVVDRDLI